MNLPVSLLFPGGFIFKLQSSKLGNTGSVFGMVGRLKDKAPSFVTVSFYGLSLHAGAVAVLFPSPGVSRHPNCSSASDVCKHGSTGHLVLCPNAGHVCF